MSENIGANAKSSLEQNPEHSKVLVLKDYCIRHRGGDCDRCARACPTGAISFSETELPNVNKTCCTSCGICFGICDAFSSNKISLLDLHERIKRIALSGDQVYFTCPENIFPGFEPASQVIVLPCLASLPPELWTLVLAENISPIIACDLSYCIDCQRAGHYAESFYKHTIKTAEKWAGNKVRFGKTIPEKKNIIKDINNPAGLDRRAAFSNLASDVSDIATGKRRLRNSEVLQDFFLKRERSRAIAQLKISDIDEINRFAPLGRSKKTLLPKRRMLLEAIELKPAIAQNIPLYFAYIEDPQSPALRDCMSACPTGALAPDPETGEISIDKSYCIACGICIDIAGTETIDIQESTALEIIEIKAEKDTDGSGEE